MYKYFQSKNNDVKELSRKEFINAIGEALPKLIDTIGGFGISIADYERGEKELNKMIYSIRKNGRNKSNMLIIVNEGCYWIEKIS